MRKITLSIFPQYPYGKSPCLKKEGELFCISRVYQWIEQALNVPGLSVENISPLIAVESSQLPGKFHEDPADRLIVATARALQAVLLTRDSKILNYGQSRYIECVKI
jgi:PIN domain nuclease of toxin-antitoxin system